MTPKDILYNRILRLAKLRQEPKQFVALYAYYKDNPVDFINDWCVTYDPRVNPSTLPFTLYPKQKDYIEWLKARWVNREDGLTEKSRDAGVTWLACAFSVWLFLFHDGQKIGWGSRKEALVDSLGDPDSIFEKMRMILSSLPKEFLPKNFSIKNDATYMKIINTDNGSMIRGEAGDNIGRGGRSSIYFKDESAFYERPERIEAALSANSDVKIDISTPNGNGNPFYRKRFGGEIPVFTFHWKDDPRKDEDWYREQKRRLDPVIVAQEIDISYDASVDNVLISGDLVDAAMRTRMTDIEQSPDTPIILGVDVARFGSDKTVIAIRQGRIVSGISIYEKLDTMQIVAAVMNLCNTMAVSAVFIDETGVGAGVVDRLMEVCRSYVSGINFGGKPDAQNYFNKRAEMWGELNEWLKGTVSLPNNSQVKTDLCGLRYKYNSNGQLVLESKDDAKKRGIKSPDIGDAIALTFAETVTPTVYMPHNHSRISGY